MKKMINFYNLTSWQTFTKLGRVGRSDDVQASIFTTIPTFDA